MAKHDILLCIHLHDVLADCGEERGEGLGSALLLAELICFHGWHWNSLSRWVRPCRRVPRRYPGVHRWLRRVYASTAAITALGAPNYIVLHGCTRGITMDIGFGMYGVAMLVTAFQTVWHARARRFDEHRAWALRLFSLGTASWSYRIDYSAWTLTIGGIGHLNSFKGVFDKLMDFSFFVPNLLVVELILRAEKRKRSDVFEGGSAVLLAVLCFLWCMRRIGIGCLRSWCTVWGCPSSVAT